MILCKNKRILRKKGSENFEAKRKRNGSLFASFSFEAKKNISENRTTYPQVKAPTPPPLPKVKDSKYSIYRQCVAGRGWGMLSCVGDHILQEFNTMYLTTFRT
jgi:hypothetical protein